MAHLGASGGEFTGSAEASLEHLWFCAATRKPSLQDKENHIKFSAARDKSRILILKALYIDFNIMGDKYFTGQSNDSYLGPGYILDTLIFNLIPLRDPEYPGRRWTTATVHWFPRAAEQRSSRTHKLVRQVANRIRYECRALHSLLDVGQANGDPVASRIECGLV